ncbi:MAG: hypothetical protein QF464_09035, partial [Myxococcota bacterium]|nr:hypothetical protein [Myxococcota bacterium]
MKTALLTTLAVFLIAPTALAMPPSVRCAHFGRSLRSLAGWRMNLRQLLVLAALLLAPTAVAMPLEMPLQGVLRDNAGAPVAADTFEMTFNLYESADAADALWTETRDVTVQGGQFRLNLGTDTPLDPSLFAASGALWLGVTVETDPELPRRPMGTTPYAFQSASASGLNCSGCVEPEALSPASLQVVREEALVAVAEAGYATNAGGLPLDGAAAGVDATDVQGAIGELKTLISSQQAATNVNEGAGSVRAHTNNFALSAYGTARDYVHVIHPTPPKVMLHLYGEQAGGAGGSDDLVVAYDFAPNDYSSGAAGSAGESALLVDNPSVFSTGSQILIHQSVGGSGTQTGTWEVASVVAVNGNTLQLVQPLQNAYATDETAKAQVVVGASFGHIELVNGGALRPSIPLAADGSKGGIVYVRANKITVRSGGVVSADGMGYQPNPGGLPVAAATLPGAGGFAPNGCGGSGGGSNQGEGEEGGGDCPTPGAAGETQSSGATPLLFGGSGGQAASNTQDGWPAGGAGGGIVVLGAQTFIAQEGATVSADGADAGGPGAGGGAGGTVALFTEQTQLLTPPSAAGGAGGPAPASAGWSGQGWEYVDNPVQTGTKSFDTRSHGGGYSPYHD